MNRYLFTFGGLQLGLQKQKKSKIICDCRLDLDWEVLPFPDGRIKTGIFDKHGLEINIGDEAVVTDRLGKRWNGKIISDAPAVNHKCADGKIKINHVAFCSNYPITLWQYWTKEKLEITPF